MGSEIVDALVAQIANRLTNPDNISPEISNPIQQLTYPIPTSAGTTKPVQQFANIETKPKADLTGGGTFFSNPVEQKGVLEHATGGGPDDDSIIEQKETVTKTHPNTVDPGNPETPLEQVRFVTADQLSPGVQSTRPVQQFITGSNISTSRPLEQPDIISNSIDITRS